MSRKFTSLLACATLCIVIVFSFQLYNTSDGKIYTNGEDGEDEKYDAPREIGLMEFEKTKDPALGYVPTERLSNAIDFTNYQKEIFSNASARLSSSYAWTPRGPVYDVVGPSNGNTRANNEYTSGRILSVLVDANDPTGNTILVGGADGGLWRTTNFLSAPASWTSVNDNFASLAVSSICQDPSNASILYFASGEASSNADAVYGRGVYKSINGGLTWTQLASTVNYWRAFKIICDASGNVYLGLRTTSAPLPSQPNGLVRSTDGGLSWTNITPTGLTSNSNCTDIEISSTGRLHASFGYLSANSNYRYTDNPSTVTSAIWNSAAVGPTTTALRTELAVLGNTLYAAPSNLSGNVVDLYRSIDGGVNWTKQNVNPFTTALSNTQGWYGLTLAINPDYPDSVIIGGLDAYLSVNAGDTAVRMTYWVGATPPYVHADHHFMQWMNVGGERRIIIGTDGGVFLSRDNGATFADRNRNISMKQFYSISVHPTLTNYMLAGAQDNGSHQLNGVGLTSSVEVTGGDGAYVHIDQDQPQYQFTSTLYNQYRRSTNGGVSWSVVNFSSSTGLPINPFDYDDASNIMYCSWASTGAPNNQIMRWNNPQTGGTGNLLTITAFTRTSQSNATAFKVSPYTANTLYVGSSRGVLVRIDNANAVTSGNVSANTTDIGNASFPVGTINCVAVGTDDNNLLAIFSNYGVSNVWFTNNGGSTWTACDGNLPDMPVRWAVFEPGNNSKVILATEAGVYTTDAISGAATVWTPNPGFPTVRTDMLKIRTSDNFIAAATHGRGIYTANFNIVLPARDVNLRGTLIGNGKSLLTWTAADVTNETQFVIQYSKDGTRFMDIATLSSGARRYEHDFGASTAYYRVIAVEKNYPQVFSNIVSVKNNNPAKGIQLAMIPNPVRSNASFELSTSDAGGRFEWQLINNNGQLLQKGSGQLPDAGRIYQPVNAAILPGGRYILHLVINGKVYSSSFIKQ